MPVSLTQKCSREPIRLAPIDDAAAARRELDGVGDQVDQDLLHRAAVGVDLADLGRDVERAVRHRLRVACRPSIAWHMSTASANAERLGIVG